MNQEELKRRMKFVNPEIADEISPQEGGPLLVFAAHQMNWEWMALASASYWSFPTEVIYQPLSDKVSEKLMVKLRSRFGIRPLPRDQSVRHILKHREQRKVIGIVADQLPRQQMDKLWTIFLNRETPFYKGITQLPYLTQGRALFARVRVVKRGYYEVEFTAIGKPPYQKGETGVLHAYIKESEKLILASPENWLWSHRRWKYNREENEELIIL